MNLEPAQADGAAAYRQARAAVRQELLTALAADPRVVACFDYGSSGQGAGDQWSDLDLALYIRDDELRPFAAAWQQWAAHFGDLLLAYTSFAGHPWAVYDTGAMPLRVDFDFLPASELERLPDLTIRATDPAQMALLDKTNGRLQTALQQRAKISLHPPDAQAAFTRLSGDLWVMLIRTHVRLLRGRYWEGRMELHGVVLESLLGLLRLESGATERWQDSRPANGIETAVSAARLAQLRLCIPGCSDSDLARALSAVADLGLIVSKNIGERENWPWPKRLGAQVKTLLAGGQSFRDLAPVHIMPVGVVESNIDDLLRPSEIKAQPARIIVDPTLEAGLDGLEGGQRLLVLFQFHRLDGYELHQHPRNDKTRPKRGVFALHSPRRPNPLGVTEVDLLRRDGNVLHVRGLDAVDGTPVLDLKLNRRNEGNGR